MVTKTAKAETPKKKNPDVSVPKNWVLINAENQVLGRLAVRIAMILSGKNKATYSRDTNMGDGVVVVNAGKVRVTGKKLTDKTYRTFSGYPSGHKEKTLARWFAEDPRYPLWHAVRGMLPRNSLGNHMLLHLKIYGDAQHPHAAQKPKELKLS